MPCIIDNLGPRSQAGKDVLRRQLIPNPDSWRMLKEELLVDNL